MPYTAVGTTTNAANNAQPLLSTSALNGAEVWATSLNNLQMYGTSVWNANGGATLQQSKTGFAGKHVISVVCAPSTYPVTYLDGIQMSLNATSGTATCSGLSTSGNYRFGPSARLSTYGPIGYKFYAAAFYGSAQTPAQVQSVALAIRGDAQARGVPLNLLQYQTPTRTYTARGDSITCGIGDTPGTCGVNSFSTTGYPSKAIALTNNTYALQNMGVSGTPSSFAVETMAQFDSLYCQSQQGANVATLMMATNDMNLTGGSPAEAWDSNVAWIRQMKAAGCKVGIIGMISRTGTANAAPWDQRKNEFNALARSGWRTAGADFFVDMGADPLLGADGQYANTTYFNADGTHPKAAGYTVLGNAVACGINGSDGSSAENINQVRVTATATATCADGGRLIDATSGNIVYTLWSAQWQTGRRIRYCNVTPSGGNTVTLTAPSDFPFDNVSGATTKTIAANSCVTLESTWNGITTTSTGDYWRTL